MRSPILLLLLAGACGTSPGDSERARQDELREARGAYRPGDELPELPALLPGATAEDFARYAVLRNPRVESAFHEWARAVAEITVARSLPDPSLSLRVETGRMLEAIVPGLESEFPGPGKLALAAEAASSAAGARRQDFEQVAVETAVRARTAWMRAAWLAEVVVARREVLGVLREIEELASAQYRVGKVSMQDVLRVKIEHDGFENEIVSLEDGRVRVVAEARSALGLASADPDPPLPERLPDPLPSLPDGDLLDRALQGNHRLLALREEIREAESMVALARKSEEPDFMLGLEVDLVSPVVWMPEAGATLPVYRDKIDAIVTAALAARHAADARLAGASLDLVVALADAHFRFRDARRRLEVVREKLLPKAEAALDAARAAYPTGLTDMTGLLDAERSLLEFRIEEATLRLEVETAQAEIVLVILGARAVPGTGEKESG